MTSSLAAIEIPAAARSGRTYLESSLYLGKLSRLPFWMVLSGVAVSVSLATYVRGRQPELLGTFAFLGLCIALVPLAMRGTYAILFGWIRYLPSILRLQPELAAPLEQWVAAEFANFDSSPTPRRFGILYTVLAVAAFWVGGAFDSLSVSILTFAVVVCVVASFLCGVGLACIFYLGRFIWRLGRRYEVRITEHGYGILSTGRMLAKCYLLVALVWCAYTFSGTWSLGGNWIPVLSLALPALVFFIGSFLVCQFPLHAGMVKFKRMTLLELDDLVSQLMLTRPADMTPDRQQLLDFYIAQIRRVNKWPEWPFSFRSFSGVVGASVAAVGPQLLQLVIPLVFQTRT